MRYGRVMILGALLLVSSGCVGSMYKSAEGPIVSDRRNLRESPALQGSVPVVRVLELARREGMVKDFPDRPDLTGLYIEVRAESRWWEILTALETATGWVYDTELKVFTIPQATHEADKPDSAGRAFSPDRLSLRPRPVCVLKIRFVRGSVSASQLEIGGGAAYRELSYAAIGGTIQNLSVTSERSYSVGVVDPSNPSGTIVKTDRKVVESGLQIEGIVARLPGGMSRCRARLQLSAFTGQELDRAVVSVPIDFDGPRDAWVKVCEFKSVDGNVRLSLKSLGVDFAAGADALSVFARVE